MCCRAPPGVVLRFCGGLESILTGFVLRGHDWVGGWPGFAGVGGGGAPGLHPGSSLGCGCWGACAVEGLGVLTLRYLQGG